MRLFDYIKDLKNRDYKPRPGKLSLLKYLGPDKKAIKNRRADNYRV